MYSYKFEIVEEPQLFSRYTYGRYYSAASAQIGCQRYADCQGFYRYKTSRYYYLLRNMRPSEYKSLYEVTAMYKTVKEVSSVAKIYDPEVMTYCKPSSSVYDELKDF
jgi:hypothetical protein